MDAPAAAAPTPADALPAPTPSPAGSISALTPAGGTSDPGIALARRLREAYLSCMPVGSAPITQVPGLELWRTL
eukprot:14124856-Heterocapsa_arctica.AAC.1